MRTEAINHDPAHTFMNTGTTISGRPSMGSWVCYGLGSECDNLPGFVVLTSTGPVRPARSRSPRGSGTAASCPAGSRASSFHSKGDPVLYLSNPAGVDARPAARRRRRRRRSSTACDDAVVDDPEIATRISQYEMAFRMQASVPELMDLSDEPKHDRSTCTARKGARRLLRRQLPAGPPPGRARRALHPALSPRLGPPRRRQERHQADRRAKSTRPTAALITDLKQRGMLDDTLVIWGGEFGRTPMAQGNGRDHHIKGFSIWMAGGGIKGGITHGATDELGYNAVEDVVHVHDLHATMLHLLASTTSG